MRVEQVGELCDLNESFVQLSFDRTRMRVNDR